MIIIRAITSLERDRYIDMILYNSNLNVMCHVRRLNAKQNRLSAVKPNLNRFKPIGIKHIDIFTVLMKLDSLQVIYDSLKNIVIRFFVCPS